MTGGTLGDLGERRIIGEILAPRYAPATRFGDDCASVALPGGGDDMLVATTDPCPPPMAAALGFDDLFYTGWLLATLNLSDLAAAGAEPLGLLTSLMLPANMPIPRFVRLLDGIDACCEAVGTTVLGGNLKETPKLDLSATAFGRCGRAELLTRGGGRRGDRVLVIGDLGAFWAGTLALRKGLIRPGDEGHPLLQNVLTPLPKTAAMRALAQTGVVTAAIDNSDGLYPSLLQLGGAGAGGVVVEADAVTFDDAVVAVADRLAVDPLRLALGWGDWQVIVACDPADISTVASVASMHGVPVHDIGKLTDGNGVTVVTGGREGALIPLDSERFTAGSWFSSGLEGYIATLRDAPLMAPRAP